ncbi:uncharacterized protein LOC111709669 [Eurytemora carolleeae]|uniref:uncharacterized protein LOC111709669 n=1 Tax=Eurytemora carolleeae TaxID=1294199 RepID=UPI000C78BFF3|nr:uncharacterized protein LOC111709669 [Eurytemora carolleeae]|eukprot:XP_023339263.1 uncharacterized protein LOC111709669 [Eurytemora affinis]
MNKANRKTLTEQQHQDTLDELGSVLGKKRREVEELVEKIGLLRDTLDCTYTVVQTGGPFLPEQLESKCKLSQRAQLLLTLSDQAVESRPTAAKAIEMFAFEKIRHLKKKLEASSEESSPSGISGSSSSSWSSEPSRISGSSPSSWRIEAAASSGSSPISWSSTGHGTSTHDTGTGQHWLLGSQRGDKSESGEFQQYLVTELTRMEQNIIDFQNQHDTFCSEFRLSLEAEVERRSQDLSVLANRLAGLIDNQAKAVGKLEGLASDQMYAEQKWVQSYLKNIRNEADRQSTNLQGFLTESFLPSIRVMSAGVQEISTQISGLQSTLVQSINTGSNQLFAFLDSQKRLILGAKDNILNLSKLQVHHIQVLGGKQEDLRKAEEGFQSKLKEAHRKMESLLSSVMAEYSQFSSTLNSTSSSTSAGLQSLQSRSQEIDSSLNLAVTQVLTYGTNLAVT